MGRVVVCVPAPAAPAAEALAHVPPPASHRVTPAHRDVIGTFLRRWWLVGGALVALGAKAARLDSDIARKADGADVQQIQSQLTAIQNQLADMSARQRAFFCRSQGTWCR